MWTMFKVFSEFVTILLLFYVLVFFDQEALAEQGWNPQALHWKARS